MKLRRTRPTAPAMPRVDSELVGWLWLLASALCCLWFAVHGLGLLYLDLNVHRGWRVFNRHSVSVLSTLAFGCFGLSAISWVSDTTMRRLIVGCALLLGVLDLCLYAFVTAGRP